jgi:hypothetical protein
VLPICVSPSAGLHSEQYAQRPAHVSKIDLNPHDRTHLFIVDHKGNSNLSPTGPLWVEGLLSVANQISRKVIFLTPLELRDLVSVGRKGVRSSHCASECCAIKSLEFGKKK